MRHLPFATNTALNDQPTLWELILPEECLGLPPALAEVDRLLDDPVFFEPFRPFFTVGTGRPSIPMETYLRMMFLRFRYDLAGFYRSRGRLLEAVAIVDALLQHAPESREIGEARSALASSIEWTALVLARGDALEWPPPPPEPGWEKVDPRVTELLAWVPEPLRRFSFYPGQVVATVGILRSAAYLGAGVLVLIALLLLRRQRGDIAVAIEYPEELRGIFRVRWRGSRKRLPDTTTEEQIRKGGASTRRQHHMVARETQFQRLFTGRYHVLVDGLLIDPVTDEVLGKIHDEKMVRVRHRRTVRVEFDVHPSTCPVDLSVVWGDRPAHVAQVAVPGLVDRPRVAAAGSIRILLPKGTHHLLVGCGDRVFDHTLVVSSFRPTAVLIDVRLPCTPI